MILLKSMYKVNLKTKIMIKILSKKKIQKFELRILNIFRLHIFIKSKIGFLQSRRKIFDENCIRYTSFFTLYHHYFLVAIMIFTLFLFTSDLSQVLKFVQSITLVLLYLIFKLKANVSLSESGYKILNKLRTAYELMF